MADSSDFQNAPNQNNGYSSDFDYIMKAVAAYEAGDMVLAMHLYLAAYEAASADPTIPRTAAVRSLREAWNLACELKERSMAEYVFEKLEPFLSGDELATCANRLQQLALDRLAEYGFSRDELEGMADMISEELLGNGSPFIQVEHMSVPSSRIGGMPFEVSVVHPANLHSDGLDAVLPVADANAADAQDAPGDDVPELDNAQLSMFEAQETLDEQTQGDDLFGSGVQEQAEEQAQVQAEGQQAMLPAAGLGSLAVSPAMPGREIQAGQMPSMPAPALDVPRDDVLTYHNLMGYDDAVDLMRKYGIGLAQDKAYLDFIEMMNRKHGLNRAPALDTLVFRSAAREDAIRFVEATVGELGLPAMRMNMEENFQGMPVLCMSARSDNHPRYNRNRGRFEGPGVLVIEDIDTWPTPSMPENIEGFGGIMMANASRGVNEALNLIRVAVEDPDIMVLCTASSDGPIEQFFYDLLSPYSIVEIANPTDAERSEIWTEIARDHPSMRTIDRVDLMRYSKGMSRYDIYMAAREAVEEAYKQGLAVRDYRPVMPQNIFEKLAAYQPLDSEEYQALEQRVLIDFQRDLDHLDDLLDVGFNG